MRITHVIARLRPAAGLAARAAAGLAAVTLLAGTAAPCRAGDDGGAAGGFLRFQAQYLRRIRVPLWNDVPEPLRARLIDLAEEPDRAQVDAAVFELYALSSKEAEIVATLAKRVQIVPKRERATV